MLQEDATCTPLQLSQEDATCKPLQLSRIRKHVKSTDSLQRLYEII